MRVSRLRLIAGTACLATALATVTVTAAPSYAAGGVAPTISVGGATDEDPGILTVSASSDSAITSISAHVTSDSVSPTVQKTVTDFTVTDGTTTDGTWHSGRLSLASYDSYRVDFAVTDADNDQSVYVTHILYTPSPRDGGVQITPDTLDYEHPVATISGTLNELDPRDGTTKPWADVHVALDWAVKATALTDDHGDYSMTYLPTDLSITSLEPELVVQDPVAARGVTQVMISAAKADVRLTIDPLPSTVDDGKTYTVTGLAEYSVSGTWKPLADAEVLSMGDSATTRTGTDGRFALVRKFTDASDVTFYVGEVTNGQFLDTANSTTTVDVHSRQTSDLTWGTFDITEYSEVHVEGRFEIAQGATKIYLQQSSTGKSSWKSLGYFMTDRNGIFKLDAYVSKPKGYWRLYFSGNDIQQPAYSITIHGSRDLTRIIHLNASPEPVRKGHKITVQGTAQKQPSTAWIASTKHLVAYYFRAKGSKKFTYEGSSKTSSTAGHFRKTFTAKKDGYWSAAWFTTSDSYVDAFSAEDYVNVK
jgi:hypothetical protein